MIWLLLLLILFLTTFYYLLKVNRYWLERGVKQGSPVPLLGDNVGMVLGWKSFSDTIKDAYNKISTTDRYVGFYQMTKPTIVIRDIELIKKITVKDFEHFMDHRTFIPETSDPLWGKNLFQLRGQRWRDMRITLSPAFTSSKMKQMFELMSLEGEKFANYFLNQNEELQSMDLKLAFSRYCANVIASASFGLEVDSLKNPKDEFFLRGLDITNLKGFWQNLKFLGYVCFPKLYDCFKIKLFPKHVGEFFRKIVKDTLNYREKNNVSRNDMINLLMEARKDGFKEDQDLEKEGNDAGFAVVEESNLTKLSGSKKIDLTLDDITSQALIFFFAGFDGLSTVMSFVAYELAVHPEIQQKLIKEVDQVKSENNKITYEALTKMKYLDMVISETLRKWPVATALDRICTKTYTIEPELPGERPLIIEEGVLLWIPVAGIHFNPNFFPEPEKFDPERFSDENKDQIKPYTYMPFGVGPRNCIGSRFALLEIKVVLYHLLCHFEITPVKKTQIPLKISTKTLNLIPEKGFWLGLKRREHVG